MGGPSTPSRREDAMTRPRRRTACAHGGCTAGGCDVAPADAMLEGMGRRWSSPASAATVALLFAVFELIACSKSSGRGDCGEPVLACSQLCQSYCTDLGACGRAPADCIAKCTNAYRCPGETPDHDRAICTGEMSRLTGTCESACNMSRSWSGCVDPGAVPGSSGGGCTEPVAECASLCDAYCAELERCATAPADCGALCRAAYRCPGETPGQDSAICNGERERLNGASCEAVCSTTARWSQCSVDGGS